MTTYLFTFRAPAEYVPTSDTFDTWSAWQAGLGARLKDRGNPGTASAALGASPADTKLGGYSLVHDGTVEIAELDRHEDRFDTWLATYLGG
jgi:hypothetical protein